MKSLYKKVFKNDQVTYGVPFHVKAPLLSKEILKRGADTEDNTDINDNNGPLEPEEILERAKLKCERMLKEAKQEAGAIIKEAGINAKKKAESTLEEAWQKGYAEGMEAARIQTVSVLEDAENIRVNMVEERDKILKSMEKEIVELVIKVARKVVAGELTANENLIVQLLRDVLSKCSNTDDAILRISPADKDCLEDDEDFQLIKESLDGLEIRKDGSLDKGSCIIETSMGSADAGVDTRMVKIEKAFREQIEGR